jgi:hypothetical protein
MDRGGQDEVRRGPYSKLPYGAGELVRTCHQITKVHLVSSAEYTAIFPVRCVYVDQCSCVDDLVDNGSMACMIDRSCQLGIEAGSYY